MTDDERWEVVVRRDASFRAAFVLGVTSTGIYCRPGCPARRPLRRNVRFFETAGQAEQAGLRACLRCRPQAEVPVADARIARVCRFIAAHRPAADAGAAGQGRGIECVPPAAPVHGGTGHLAARVCRRPSASDLQRRELRGGRGVLDAAVEAGWFNESRGPPRGRSSRHDAQRLSRWRRGAADPLRHRRDRARPRPDRIDGFRGVRCQDG